MFDNAAQYLEKMPKRCFDNGQFDLWIFLKPVKIFANKSFYDSAY